MISFAGVDLLLEDLEGWLKILQERHQPLEDLRLFGCEPPMMRSTQQYWKQEIKGVNYPGPPRLRLNSLYWPTGATRWSRGVFLATDAQLNQILERVGSGSANDPAQLKIGDGPFRADEMPDNEFHVAVANNKIIGNGLSTEMHLLQPRPITVDQSDVTLWLLPLVDQRYYWQYRFTSIMDKAQIETWDDLFVELEASLNITPDGLTWDEVHADYGTPSPELMRAGENAAMLLDAASRSVGQRIVRWFDGTVYSIGTTEASTQHDDNTTDAGFNNWKLIAGDDFSNMHLGSVLPSTVRVQFRDKTGVSWSDIDVNASSIGYTDTTDSLVKTFHSVATQDDDSETMANRIATDYFLWLQKHFDYTFLGVKYWKPSGYEDYVEWQLAELHVDHDGTKKFLCQTRVVSMPPDVGLFDLYQESSIFRQDGLWRVRLEGELEEGGIANASVYYWDYHEEEWVDTEEVISVREALGLCTAVPAGSFGFAARSGEADFVLVAADCVCDT